MKSRIKRLSACLALVFSWSGVTFPVYADLPPAMGTTGNNSMTRKPAMNVVARLKKLRGEVLKSEPINPSTMSNFLTAMENDGLVEGTYIQTGKNGMTDLNWEESGITSRLFFNTLVRIAPMARTVFLDKGQLVFQKHPRNADCLIDTKRLQARIHGTTVKISSNEREDTLLVTESESYVDVYNKMDGSHVRLTPGVLLEVRGKLMTLRQKASIQDQNREQLIAEENGLDLRYNPNKGELIFQEKNSSTVAYTANATAVLSDPLIVGDKDFAPISSIDLIRSTMSKFPGSDNLIGNAVESCQSIFNNGKADKAIAKGLKIESVPTKVGYYIGPNVGADKSISLPEMAYTDYQPLGILKNHDWSKKNIASNKFQPSVAHVSIPVLPYTENPALSAEESEGSNSSLQVISISKNN